MFNAPHPQVAPMAKHRPRLNVFGRQLLVHRITDEGWPVAHAATAVGVSRATAYKWLRRYRIEGEAGLLDRRSRRAAHATQRGRSSASLLDNGAARTGGR